MKPVALFACCALSLSGPAAVAQTESGSPVATVLTPVQVITKGASAETQPSVIYPGQNVAQITPGATDLWVLDTATATLTGYPDECAGQTAVRGASPTSFAVSDQRIFLGNSDASYQVIDRSNLRSLPGAAVPGAAGQTGVGIAIQGNYAFYVTASANPDVQQDVTGSLTSTGLNLATQPGCKAVAYGIYTICAGDTAPALSSGNVTVLDAFSGTLLGSTTLYGAAGNITTSATGRNGLVWSKFYGLPIKLMTWQGQPAILTNTGTVMTIGVVNARGGGLPVPSASVVIQGQQASPALVSDAVSDGKSFWMVSPAQGVLKVDGATGAVTPLYSVPGFTNIVYTGNTVVAIGATSIVTFNPQDGRIAKVQNVSLAPTAVAFDGASIWIADRNSGTVRNDLVQ